MNMYINFLAAYKDIDNRLNAFWHDDVEPSHRNYLIYEPHKSSITLSYCDIDGDTSYVEYPIAAFDDDYDVACAMLREFRANEQRIHDERMLGARIGNAIREAIELASAADRLARLQAEIDRLVLVLFSEEHEVGFRTAGEDAVRWFCEFAEASDHMQLVYDRPAVIARLCELGFKPNAYTAFTNASTAIIRIE